MVEFVVSAARLVSANKIIREKCSSLTSDQLFDITDELRFGLDQSSLTSKLDKMRFAMTDLQTVAFAAAIVAVVECGSEVKDADSDVLTADEEIPF